MYNYILCCYCILCSYSIVLTLLYTGTDIVDEKKLYRLVILDWENLGVQLGLNKVDLDCISKDNANNPDRTKDCCRAVLKKWLESKFSPTWGELEDAVNAIKNPSTAKNDIAGKCLYHK